MKKLTVLIVLSLVVGALGGCGSGSSPTGASLGGSFNPGTEGSPEDRAAVVAEANRHPEFMEDGVYQSSAPMNSALSGGRSGLATEAAITPVTFTRRVRVANRTFEFAFADTDSTGRPTTAVLTVHRDLTGTLTITAADTTGSFNPPIRITKPITETWTRRLSFTRTPGGNGGGDDDDDDDGGRGHGESENGGRDRDRNRDRNGNWQLTGVSAVLVESPNGVTDIVSLRVEAAGLDTTLSDPLGLIQPGSLPVLAPGTPVTITATTNAADDIVLLLARDRRFRLHSTGGNTYSGTFTAPAAGGAQHFGINVLSHLTLYDDTAPYDSETWLFSVVGRGSGSLASGQ